MSTEVDKKPYQGGRGPLSLTVLTIEFRPLDGTQRETLRKGACRLITGTPGGITTRSATNDVAGVVRQIRALIQERQPGGAHKHH